jgi:hypothetical protein
MQGSKLRHQTEVATNPTLCNLLAYSVGGQRLHSSGLFSLPKRGWITPSPHAVLVVEQQNGRPVIRTPQNPRYRIPWASLKRDPIPSGSPSRRHRGSVEKLPTILAGALRRVHR